MLIALREAGLDTMPGGGAEVFSPGVRATIADKKLAGEDYIDVHRDGAPARHPQQLHDALRPRRDDRGSHRAPARCCATCRTRRAASSPTSRSRIIPTTTSSGATLGRRAPRPPASTTCSNLAVGRLFLDNFDAHQVALDHGDAVPLADRRCTSA